MIGKVLVPMDSSEHARNAANLAIEIASKLGAEIHFLHVLPRDRMTEELREMAYAEHLSGKQADAVGDYIPNPGSTDLRTGPMVEGTPRPTQKFLEVYGSYIYGDALERARKAGVRNARGSTEYGEPAEQILRQARALGADLIVMGRRGLSEIAGLLVGSVTHKVLHHGDCACLTVK